MDRELLNYTQNRELSWLRFDQRVLEEARDKSVPLLERMKFVAIFTSNLDEFFMIRVGSLYDMVQTDDRHRDSRSGMTPQEQLDAIYAAVAPLYKERDKTYAGIKKELSHTESADWTLKNWRQTRRNMLRNVQRADPAGTVTADRRQQPPVPTSYE